MVKNVSCIIVKVKVNALCDTGSTITVINKEWLKDNIPDKVIEPIQNILGEPLIIKTANNTDLTYDGRI